MPVNKPAANQPVAAPYGMPAKAWNTFVLTALGFGSVDIYRLLKLGLSRNVKYMRSQVQNLRRTAVRAIGTRDQPVAVMMAIEAGQLDLAALRDHAHTEISQRARQVLLAAAQLEAEPLEDEAHTLLLELAQHYASYRVSETLFEPSSPFAILGRYSAELNSAMAVIAAASIAGRLRASDVAGRPASSPQFGPERFRTAPSQGTKGPAKKPKPAFTVASRTITIDLGEGITLSVTVEGPSAGYADELAIHMAAAGAEFMACRQRSKPTNSSRAGSTAGPMASPAPTGLSTSPPAPPAAPASSPAPAPPAENDDFDRDRATLLMGQISALLEPFDPQTMADTTFPAELAKLVEVNGALLSGALARGIRPSLTPPMEDWLRSMPGLTTAMVGSLRSYSRGNNVSGRGQRNLEAARAAYKAGESTALAVFLAMLGGQVATPSPA